MYIYIYIYIYIHIYVCNIYIYIYYINICIYILYKLKTVIKREVLASMYLHYVRHISPKSFSAESCQQIKQEMNIVFIIGLTTSH